MKSYLKKCQILLDFAPPDVLTILNANQNKGKYCMDEQNGLFQNQSKSTPPDGITLRGLIHSNLNSCAVWSPDSKLMALCDTDEHVHILESQNGKEVSNLTSYEIINALSWSPSGKLLAAGGINGGIQVWDRQTGFLFYKHTKKGNPILSFGWSPAELVLIVNEIGGDIELWDALKGDHLWTIPRKNLPYSNIGISKWSPSFEDSQNSELPLAMASSPKGEYLACSTYDGPIALVSTTTWRSEGTLIGHADIVISLSWSHKGNLLASGAKDGTIRIWSVRSQREIRRLEGFAASVIALTFSGDDQFLVSHSDKNLISIWRTDTFELLSSFSLGIFDRKPVLSFHSSQPLLITNGNQANNLSLWEIDTSKLLGASQLSVQYTNAKVVLMGDTGVGKSGLGLVLSGQTFKATDSTHGRHVLVIDKSLVELEKSPRKELRETFLWDLAGQAGYRLIHQLHLKEVAIALILFDARSETDPFVGVRHWEKAISQAHRIQGASAPPLKKFLVAARVDRGGVGVSRERIDSLVRELGFDDYIETSAKQGMNIRRLLMLIKKGIDWSALPKVTSSALFQRINSFLVNQKANGLNMITIGNLFSLFIRNEHLTPSDINSSELRLQFETCIGLMESRDLIRRLNFGNLLLLQPEILDAYASALVNAVKDEPDGLGSIRELLVREGQFAIPPDERLNNKAQEELLLIAMIEDLLRHELTFREETIEGAFLVFPSQSTRHNPDLPDPEGKSVSFYFEGPVLNIYATLAVRLSHSELFQKKELWKDAITYTHDYVDTYGISLHNSGEGQGELTIFFDKYSDLNYRRYFEEFIVSHLRRSAIPNSVKRHRIYTCHRCGLVIDNKIIMLRRKFQFTDLDCPVCQSNILLQEEDEVIHSIPQQLSEKVTIMENAANSRRESGALETVIQGKRATKDYDVLLCYNWDEKDLVKSIGSELIKQGVLPWLDDWDLPPGKPWHTSLEQQIEHIHSVAVFIGASGIGPWQNLEIMSVLREFLRRECPIIPVILENCTVDPNIPTLLRNMARVDFRQKETHPMARLIWGITGKQGSIV